MPNTATLLTVLPDDRPLRLTPTDVTQFVLLEQCERYLRFRLAERAGQDFMAPYGVVQQRITPLLSLSGHEFEVNVEASIAGHCRTIDLSIMFDDRPPDFRRLIRLYDEAGNRLDAGKRVLWLSRSLIEDMPARV